MPVNISVNPAFLQWLKKKKVGRERCEGVETRQCCLEYALSAGRAVPSM